MTVADRLSVGDLASFWAEGPTTPMQIGLAAVLDGPPVDDARLERLRHHLERRTLQLPRFRQRVRWTHFGQGLPLWTRDADFDVEHHVTVRHLPPDTTPDEFYAWAAAAAVEPLDRDRPLWRLVLVPDLARGSTGLLLVVHHVVVDGLAGVASLSTLLGSDDPSADTEPPVVGVAPGGLELVRDNAARRWSALFGAIRGLTRRRHVLHAASGTASALRTRAPVTSLAGDVGRGRRTTVLRCSLPAALSAARNRGVTVNDLALAVVTTGLRTWLGERGDLTAGMTLRSSMPVAVPGRRQNSGRMVVVPLPVGEPDPAVRLRLIRDHTHELKSSGADVAHADVTGSPWFPVWLVRAGIRWLARHGGERVNCFVTNVTGPARELSLDGARVQEVGAFAPLVAGVRLGVTVFSYADQLSITLLGDDGLPGWPSLAGSARRALLDLVPAAAPVATGDRP